MTHITNRITPLLVALLALLGTALASCSDNDKFTVKGTVEGGSTMNLRFLFVGDDVTNNVLTAARDGKFEFSGEAPADGTMVRILDNDYRPLATMFVRNGDEMKVKIDPRNPYGFKVEGNDESERLSQWVAGNAKTLSSRDSRAINAAVAKYVGAHKDDVVSAMLLATEYDAAADPAGAARLAESIAPAARLETVTGQWTAVNQGRGASAADVKVLPIKYFDRNDTLSTFRPADARVNVLVFSNYDSQRADSLLPALKKLKGRLANRRLALLDMSLDLDTMTWRRFMRSDSVDWPTAWVAGGIAAPAVERLAVERLPFFIVADSAGRQVYRGPSLTRAVAVVDSLKPLP